MKYCVYRLFREEAGQDLTEYGLLFCLLLLVSIQSLSLGMTAIRTVYATGAAALGQTTQLWARWLATR